MAAFLQQAMDSGQLRQADPRLAARQLKALLEAEWQTRFLLQVCEGPGPDDISASVGARWPCSGRLRQPAELTQSVTAPPR